ncbi:hypothetical protein ABRY23_09220 [Melioribacteraceae bacterium 4301-Me]|uniref:hypothetical protein n=1 Tax=Pyranulibacter aquaticus TaxID=3163344 RepID=UPI00359A37AE
MILENSGLLLNGLILKRKTNQVGANLKVAYTDIILLTLSIFIGGCVNPFAPAMDKSTNSNGSLISDLKTVNGVFQNFQYAYTFKDTLIYGQLIANDFVFTYHDYDLGVDKSWGRDDEMKVTYGLFQNTQRLDLIWNDIVSMTGDSTRIIRSFNLTITFNPTDIVYIDGKVNLELIKIDGKWKIRRWIDESNF